MATEIREPMTTEDPASTNAGSWVVFWICLAVIIIGALTYAFYKPNMSAIAPGSTTTETTTGTMTAPSDVNANDANMANPNEQSPAAVPAANTSPATSTSGSASPADTANPAGPSAPAGNNGSTPAQ